MHLHILAYIDPGAGALIWQSIVGIFVGLFFYLRKTRKWIGAMLSKIFRLEHQPVKSEVPVPITKGNIEAEHR